MKYWLIIVFSILTLIFVGLPAAFEGRDAFLFVKNVTYDVIVFWAAFAFFWTCRDWLTAILTMLLWLNLTVYMFYYTDDNVNQMLTLLSMVVGVGFVIYQKFRKVRNNVV